MFTTSGLSRTTYTLYCNFRVLMCVPQAALLKNRPTMTPIKSPIRFLSLQSHLCARFNHRATCAVSVQVAAGVFLTAQSSNNQKCGLSDPEPGGDSRLTFCGARSEN